MGNNSSQNMSAPVTVAAQARHTATLIFLHGLGDTGHGWADAFRMMNLQNVKCVCPNAPILPVTLNGGMKMPSWFDIYGLSSESPQDEEGIMSASEILKKMIDDEVKKGIPTERIAIGGFSQGGCVALYTALTHSKKLAGVVGLSTWLPLHKKFDELIKGREEDFKNLPIFQGHGTGDPLVQFQWAKLTSECLSAKSQKHTFKSYSMMHSSCPEELSDVKSFLERILP